MAEREEYECWLESIKLDHNAFLKLPKNRLTNELCLEAVRRDYSAIYYIPEEYFTKEICLTAHAQSPSAIRYVPENLREFYIKHITEDDDSGKQ